ncbi:hypothetical protein [Mucilaginibacter sp. SP1R1]|uniref:hypothetical protein n=1 Tax=Mucilaginibacter sp. SP1R1 TaxID=2723091 RepID=UPI001620CADC|nr:hypothetical protein [Mucilaginibacter sp. SP1R1]MBB6150478.1 hypothetical protein [Mucilaginibacter sp. SP1R1]
MTEEEMLNQYLRDKQKHKAIKKIDKEDVSLIAMVSMATSYSEHEDVSTLNSSFEECFELLKAARDGVISLKEVEGKFEQNKAVVISLLEKDRASLLSEILDEKFEQYQAISLDPTKIEIAARMRSVAFSLKKNIDKARRYDLTAEVIKTVKSKFFEISLNLLKTKVNDSSDLILLCVASIIENPIRLSIHNIELDLEWEKFPLKWYSYKFTVTDSRKYFKLYKWGESLDFFIERYIEHHLETINKQFKDHFFHRLKIMDQMVNDTVSCYKNELFSSCLCTILPLIEGALWAFADYYNFIEKNLFTEIDGKKHIRLLNGKLAKDYTIGDLLKRTVLSEFFDDNFISYFCDELYNERNPILHGKEVEGFCKINAAKKLLTFDFLSDRMEMYFKEVNERQMDMLLGETILNKLLAGEPMSDEDHVSLSSNSRKMLEIKNSTI